MNIFCLSPSPVESAHYHCDQHLHKMILESAQLLSTSCFQNLSSGELEYCKKYLYKPSHHNHPCALWLTRKENIFWLTELVSSLESIRESLDHPRHSSTEVALVASTFLLDSHRIPGSPRNSPSNFPLAITPGHIRIDPRYPDIHSRYQAYYRWKNSKWLLEKGSSGGMTWKNRTRPEFMYSPSTPINP